MRRVLWPIIRISFAVGAIVLFLLHGIRWAIGTRDAVKEVARLPQALAWIDQHPGWVLAVLGIVPIVLLIPERRWRFFAGLFWHKNRGAGEQPRLTDLAVLEGAKEHIADMLGGLDEKRKVLDEEQYEQHLKSVCINTGQVIRQARERGVFDQHIDLLGILETTEERGHTWQVGSSSLPHDRFQAFWFWLNKHDKTPYEDRGDYRPYTLKRLIEMLDARIQELQEESTA